MPVPFSGYSTHGTDGLMTDKIDPTTWLNPVGAKSIKLDITQGGTVGGTGLVEIQQERIY